MYIHCVAAVVVVAVVVHDISPETKRLTPIKRVFGKARFDFFSRQNVATTPAKTAAAAAASAEAASSGQQQQH